MARSKLDRLVGAPPKFPSDWQPRTIISPATGLFLDDTGAFNLMADQIEGGYHIDVMTLDVPLGDTGYVMRFMYGAQLLYTKFQVKGRFIARSFHLDYAQTKLP